MQASSRVTYGLGISLLAGAAAFMACGGDDGGDKGTGDTPGGTGGTNGKTATLTVLPSPGYTGFDGTHTFQIPFIVKGKTGATWTVDKPALVDLKETAEGLTVTAKGAGTVTLTATSGTEFGQSSLTISQYAASDWDIGDKRYNASAGVFPDGGIPNDPAAAMNIMLNKDGACTTCHGATASILKVQHTPQQTGGYSDAELVTIFTMGMKPAGAVQHTAIPAYFWGMFHAWNATDDQKRGLTVYLRALTPTSQGDLDYPMITRPTRDGGTPGGGGTNTPTTGSDAGGSTTTPTTGSDAGSTGTTTTSDAGAATSDAG
jgi:hypothetical protein